MFKGSLNIVSGIIAALFLGSAGVGGLMGLSQPTIVGILLAGGLLALSPRMVLEWEKGVLLRLGKFNRVLEPGITWIIPGLDIIVANVDMRVRTTTFSAEKARTTSMGRNSRACSITIGRGCCQKSGLKPIGQGISFNRTIVQKS